MKKNNLLVIIGCILFFVGCEKEKIVEVYKTPNWKSHPDFQYENSILLNSASVDSSFMVIAGTNYFGHIGFIADLFGSYDSIFDDNYIKQIEPVTKPLMTKIPITPQLTISYDESKFGYGRVNFISTTKYSSNVSYLSNLNMSDIDTTFTGYSFSRPTWNDCVEINNNGQVLIPYYSVSNGEFQLRLLWVNTRQTENFNPTEILGTKIIKIVDKYQSRVDFLQSIKDIFYVTTESKTYRINSNGDLTQKFDDYQIYSIIPRNDTLYAFGYDFNVRQNEFIYSTDNGMIWNKATTSESIIAYLNFAEIDNKIIGFYRSQIWQFTFNPSGYKVVELDNDGLVGKIITSFAEYKGKAYATTHSGLFYKDLDDLFKVKE